MGESAMESLRQDVAYGVRMLVKNPAFTLIAVLTLALGIGANAAMFSVVNGFLFKPLPVRDPRGIYVVAYGHEGNQDPHSLSWLDYQDYLAQNDTIESASAYAMNFIGLSHEGQAQRVLVSYVTGNYFSMLGLEPVAGRLIRPEEGTVEGADPVVVLSHAYWQRRFGGDASIVGNAVSINGRAFTVIGVAPEGFRGTYFIADTQVFIPLAMAGVNQEYANLMKKRDEHTLHTLVRLRPGVSRQQAQAALEVVTRRLAEEYPSTNKTNRLFVLPEYLARPEPQSGNQVPLTAAIFMGLAGLVLLVACVNVANLLLARATVRNKEFAIRAALGAGRMRLVRQLVTESVLLAMAGGAAGAMFGLWASRLLTSIRLPGDIPFVFDFSFDWRVFSFIAAFALATGIVVGVVPALRASRADISDALRDGGRAVPGGAGRHRLRNALVVAQVAGSLTLLVAAGLFVRSLQQARKMDLGFRPENILNLSLDPVQQAYDEARAKGFFDELERRVRALPGVVSAAYAHSVPMGYYSIGARVQIEGRAVAPGEQLPAAGYNAVGDAYFDTMGIRILRGRALGPEDAASSRRVAVVNELMAQKLWPNEDALGKRFRIDGADGPLVEIVGIVQNGKYQFSLEDPRLYFYVPLVQDFRSQRVLHVRTAGLPTALSSPVQDEIRALDATMPVYDIITMEQSLEGGNGFFLLAIGAWFAAVLGLLGMTLAIVGVYGVVSYAVSQRTHEIGIRMALGAQRFDIVKMILGQGLGLVLIGMGIGLVAAFGLAQLLATLLYGVKTTDPLTFGAVSLLLAAVALVACWIPARRATRVDPMVALRYE
jgi:predicted permease